MKLIQRYPPKCNTWADDPQRVCTRYIGDVAISIWRNKPVPTGHAEWVLAIGLYVDRTTTYAIAAYGCDNEEEARTLYEDDAVLLYTLLPE